MACVQYGVCPYGVCPYGVRRLLDVAEPKQRPESLTYQTDSSVHCRPLPAADVSWLTAAAGLDKEAPPA